MQNEDGSFEDEWTTAPSGALPLEEHLTGIFVKYGDTEYKTSPIVVEASGDSVGLKLTMNYNYYGTREINALENAGRYVYYQVPENVSIQNKATGPNCYTSDPDYSTTIPCGYYTIAQNGLVVIQFTQAYIDYVKGKVTEEAPEPYFSGHITLSCNVSRADSASGDQTVDVNDGGISFDVEFPDKDITMTKNGSPGRTGEGSNVKQYIDWTITITNPNGYHDMTAYTLSDFLTVDEEDASVDLSTATVTPNCGEICGGEYVFTSTPQENTITITYRQMEPKLNTEIKNTATLTSSKPTEKDVSVSQKITLTNEVDAVKTGKPDYWLDTDFDISTPEIEWTIDVSNKIGNSLGKVWVKDAKLSETALQKVYYLDASGSEVLLTKDTDYTISGDTLTFADNCVASNAKVVYRASAETADNLREVKTNTNEVTIGTNDTSSEKPKVPSEARHGSVGYVKELLLIKDPDGDRAYQRDSESVKWYIRLVSNATSYDPNSWATTFDDQSIQTIDGYTITDAAFAGLEASDFSLNVFHSTNGGAKENLGADKVTITKQDDTTILITVNDGARVNDLEIYYNTPLTAEQKTAYQNNEAVTVNNTATANGDGMMGTDGSTYTFQTRTEAQKTYSGMSNNNNVVYGNEDTTDRELYWQISLIKDQGFAEGDSSVVDVMDAKNTNRESVSGLHYMTETQLNNIKLYGKADEDASWTLLDPALYTITDQNGSAISGNSTVFKVTFNSAIASTNYRFINVDYHTTAKTSGVTEQMGKIQFTNACTFNNVTYDSSSHPEFERKDVNVVEPLTLSLTKTWADGRNMFETRPAKVRVLVEYAAADAAPGTTVYVNEPAENSIEWHPYSTEAHPDGIYEFDASGSDANDSFTLGTDFPQWSVTQEGTRRRYYYRIKELAEDRTTLSNNVKDSDTGYTVTYQTDSVFADAGTKGFALTNTTDRTYAKTAVDTGGSAVSSLDLVNVPRAEVTIGGEKKTCFIFGWRIISTLTNGSYTLIDTLPKGAVFIDGSDSTLSAYRPKLTRQDGWSGWDGWLFMNGTPTQTGNTLTIQGANNALKELVYYTAIPVSQMERLLSEGKLTNSVVIDDNDLDEAEVAITASAPIEEDEELLTKGFTTGIIPGVLNYTLTVNPDGKLLSSEDYIEIVDDLSLDTVTADISGRQSSKTMNQLNVTLNNVVVHPIVNGTVDRMTELNCSYRTEYDVTEVSNERSITAEWHAHSNYGQYWVVTGWNEDETLTINAPQGSLREVRFFSIDFDGSDSSKENSNYIKQVAFNDAGTHEFEIPAGTKSIIIYEWGKSSNERYDISSVTAKMVKHAPVRLYVTVPDGQPVQVEYTYNVEGYTSDDVLFFKNAASFETNNVTATDTKDGSKLLVTDSDAGNTTRNYLKIYKTDISDDGTNDLEATFHVYRYNEGSWEKLTGIVVTDDIADGHVVGKYRAMTFAADGTEKELRFAASDDPATEDVENLHNFSMPAGLYKFVETQAPAGYNPVDSSDAFTFYYAYKTAISSLPEAYKDKAQYIADTGKINLKNSKKISLTAEKVFTGYTEAEKTALNGATVELELLWSTSRSISHAVPVLGQASASYPEVTKFLEVAEDFNPVKTVTYSLADNADNTVRWDDLPTGHEDSPVFYFVREKSYTIGGATYTYDAQSKSYLAPGGALGSYKAIYTNNGTNTNNQTIRVNNSKGLTIRKLWVSGVGENMKAVTPPREPGESERMKVRFRLFGTLSGGTTVELDLSNVTLDESNGYTYELPEEENALTDVSGNKHTLSEFVDFEVRENLTSEQRISLYNKYREKADYNKDLVQGTGILTIINTNITSPTTNAGVEKLWDGEKNANINETVQVQLIQSASSGLTKEQIRTAAQSAGTFRNGSNVLVIEKVGNAYTTETYALDSAKQLRQTTISPTGIISVVSSDGSLIISGEQDGTATLTVHYMDDSTEELTVTVLTPTAALTNGSWSKLWENLPVVDAEDEPLYYYVCELNEDALTDYNAYYTTETSGGVQKTTIDNRKPTKLTVEKKWQDRNGQPIILDSSAQGYEADLAAMVPDTVNVKLYRVPQVESTQSPGDLTVRDKSYKIMAVGDSITFGYIGGNDAGSIGGYRPHFVTKLEELQYTSFEMIGPLDNYGKHNSMSGLTIAQIESYRVPEITSETDVIILMAGTNDVLHTNEIIDTVGVRFKSLVDAIYAKAPDAKLYIVSPPRIAYDANYISNSSQADQDARMTKLRTAIENVVETEAQTHYCKYLDFYTYLNEYAANSGVSYANYLADYTHPSSVGYKLLGEYLASQIDKDLRGAVDTGDITNPSDTTVLSAEQFSHIFTSANEVTKDSDGNTLNLTLEKANGYQLNLENLERTDENGQPYLYYIVEGDKAAHVLSGRVYELTGEAYKNIEQVAYAHNGQQVNTGTAIQITNQIKQERIRLRKVWEDDETHDPVTVTVYRSTDPDVFQQQLFLKLPETVYLSPGKTMTVKGNLQADSILTQPDSAVATVTIDPNNKRNLIVTAASGANPGDRTTVRVKDINGNTAMMTIAITEPMELAFVTAVNSTEELTAYEMTVGTPYTLNTLFTQGETALWNREGVTFTSSDPRITVDSSGTLTAHDRVTDPVTITASYGDATAEIAVTAKWAGFTISAPDTIGAKEGQNTANVVVNSEHGTVELSIVCDPEGLATISGNVITANTDGTTGTILVTATREDGETATCEIQVIADMNAFRLSEHNVTLKVGESVDIYGINGDLSEYNLHSYNHNADTSIVDLDFATGGNRYFTITGKSGGNTSVTIHKDGWSEQDVVYVTVLDILSAVASDTEMIAGGEPITVSAMMGSNIVAGAELEVVSGSEYVDYSQENGVMTLSAKTGTAGNVVQVRAVYHRGQADEEVSELVTIPIVAAPSYLTKLTQSQKSYTIDFTNDVTISGISYKINSVESLGQWNYPQLTLTVNKNQGGYSQDATSTIEFTDTNTYHWINDYIFYNNGNYNAENGIASVSGSSPISINRLELSVNDKAKSIIIDSLTITYSDGTTTTYPTPPSPTIQSLPRLLSVANAAPSRILRNQNAQQAIAAKSIGNTGFFLMGATIQKEKVATVTFSDEYQLNLAPYDANGNPYYYWVEEAVPSGYKAQYAFIDTDDTTFYSVKATAIDEDSVMEILNTPTEEQPESSTLPETGGHGTAIYYTIGAILLMLSAAGYVTVKRRRWFDE